MGLLEQQQVADQLWRRRVDERLDEHFERLEEHAAALELGERRMNLLAEKIDLQSTILQRVDTNTKSMVDLFQAWGGFTTVSKWILAVLIGISAALIALGVIFWFLRTGDLPKKAEVPIAPAHVAAARNFGARGRRGQATPGLRDRRVKRFQDANPHGRKG